MRPAVPRVDFMPLPTTAIRARSDSISMESGLASLWIAETTFCSFSINSSSCTTIVMVSMPEGMCSKEISLSSNACSTFLPNPISEFIISL